MERSEHHMGHQMGEERRRYWRGRAMRLWWTAFAFGAAVGGLAGLLFAPRRGEEMRAALSGYFPQQGVSNEFRNRVSRMLASGRISPSEMVMRTQHELDQLRGQAINRLQDARLRAKIMQKQAELRYLQGKEKLTREV